MARGPARRRHRSPLRDLRPSRPPRASNARTPTGGIRVARRPGGECGRDRRPGGVTAAATIPEPEEGGPLAVFRYGGFLRLWLSQAATQVGGNMVLFGLTVIVVNSTSSNTANSILILSFLVPAVLFSAVGGGLIDPGHPPVIPVSAQIPPGPPFVGAVF